MWQSIQQTKDVNLQIDTSTFLRKLEKSDAFELLAVRSDITLMRYIDSPALISLDEALQQIQQPISPTPAQHKSEPRKRKVIRELEQQPTTA